MQQIGHALNHLQNEVQENRTMASGPQRKISPENIAKVMLLLRDLAIIKPLSDSQKENADRFYEIHAEALLEFPLEAIKAAIDYFVHDDEERHKSVQGKFPLPAELKSRVLKEEAAIRWRNEQAIKARYETQNAPTPAQDHPLMIERRRLEKVCEDMSPYEVVAASHLIRTAVPGIDAFEACARIKAMRT